MYRGRNNHGDIQESPRNVRARRRDSRVDLARFKILRIYIFGRLNCVKSDFLLLLYESVNIVQNDIKMN